MSKNDSNDQTGRIKCGATLDGAKLFKCKFLKLVVDFSDSHSKIE
jgi:hypothetical protein